MPSHINGIGTMYLGQRDFHPDGSYVTTEFITLVFLPVIPLRSFRLIKESEMNQVGYSRTEYRIVDRVSLNLRQVLSVYAVAYGCIASLVVYASLIGPGGLLHDSIGTSGVGFALVLVSATWPLLLGWYLRHAAKRRALRESPPVPQEKDQERAG